MHASLKVEQLTSKLDDDGEELEGFTLAVRVGCMVGRPMLAGPRTRFSGLRVNGVDYPGVVVCEGGEEIVILERDGAYELAKAEDSEDG